MIHWLKALFITVLIVVLALIMCSCAVKPKLKQPEITFPFCGTGCEYAYITNQTNLDIIYNF